MKRLRLLDAGDITGRRRALLTTGDIARLYGYHIQTVKYWIRNCDFPSPVQRASAKGWRYWNRVDVERFLEEKKGYETVQISAHLNG